MSKRTTVRIDIAGVDVVSLAEEFGTPLYVYDAETIRCRFAELRQFDVVRYAQKACSNLAILALLRELGALVDAVSAGEIHRALAAGYVPNGDPHPSCTRPTSSIGTPWISWLSMGFT